MSQGWIISICLLAFLHLGGCTPTRTTGFVRIEVPDNFRHATRRVPAIESIDFQAWWKYFKDPVLDVLIDRALAANHDIKMGQSRVRQARSMVIVAKSIRYPTLDLFSAGGREKRLDRVIALPGNQGPQLFMPMVDFIMGGLNARWELDLFGGRQLETEEAIAQADGQQEMLYAIRVGLLAELATGYLNLRGMQQRIVILRRMITVQRERLETTRHLYHAGLTNSQDAAQQEAMLHAIEGMLPALMQAADTIIQRLDVLAGGLPKDMASQLTQSLALPEGEPVLPAALPSSLLERRPDLRHARTQLEARAAGLGAARAELFPRIVLSAGMGAGSLAAGGLPSLAESVYILGSGMTAPLFNAGRIRARIAGSEAQLDEAAAHYEKTFLVALEDVENAFLSRTTAMTRHHHLAAFEAATADAHRLADLLYTSGIRSYLLVLDARLDNLRATDQTTRSRTEALVSLVSLYRALGGGWDEKALWAHPGSLSTHQTDTLEKQLP